MLATTVLSALAITHLATHMAAAQDAGWVGGNAGDPGEWLEPNNWNPQTVPAGTATFGASSVTSVSSGGLVTIGAITFTNTAPAYTITTNDIFIVGGAGVTNNNTSVTQTFNVGAFMLFKNGSSASAGPGTVTYNNNFQIFLQDNATAGNAVINNGGDLEFNNTSKAGTATIVNTATIAFQDSSSALNANISNASSGVITFNTNSTGGNANISNDLGGLVDFSPATGPNGDNKITVGSIAGAGNFNLGANELTVGSSNLSTEVSGVISGVGGSIVKVGTGTLTLSGSNTYTGATTVNAGALVVNGDISPSSGVTVNSGATLGGIGQLPTTVINSGGTFAPGPGTPMNVIGDLTLNSGSTFRVGSSGGVVVTGTANLGGLLQIIPQTRVNAATTFTFLSAGTVSGTFDSISFTNSALARNAMVSFVGGDILLTLDPGLLSPMLPASANLNQRRVANGIDNALIGGAQPVAGFNTLLGLAGAQLTNALTQASGPAAAAAQQTAAQSASGFMGAMFNPYSDGRGAGYGFGPMGYAPAPTLAYGSEDDDTDNALAYAEKKARRKSAQPLASFGAPLWQPQWSAWGSPFGGQATINGDATAGTTTTTARAAGFAAGLDYRASANTVLGFALAGGGGGWSLANGLGGGSSDTFQVGAFVSNRNGPAYISGGLAYGAHWMSTNRAVTIAGADKLEADFFASTLSTRLEGGYRAEARDFAATPYGAVQMTTFWTPAYAERATAGASTFALSFSNRPVTSTRFELGSWADKRIALVNGDAWVLRARLAWAHDFNNDQTVNAAFQTLPGSNFTVGGAVPAADSLLVSAAAEYAMRNGWRIGGRFDGEFSSNRTSYAGTGTVRKVW